MVEFLFSDKLRFLKLFLTLLMTAVLVWWGAGEAIEKEMTFVEAAEDVETHQGEGLAFAGRIIDKEGELITVRERGMEVLLSAGEVPELTEVPLGKVVSGRGLLSAEGRINVVEFHYHRYHEIKLWLSLIISIGMFVWFWRKFKWDFRGLVFKKR